MHALMMLQHVNSGTKIYGYKSKNAETHTINSDTASRDAVHSKSRYRTAAQLSRKRFWSATCKTNYLCWGHRKNGSYFNLFEGKMLQRDAFQKAQENSQSQLNRGGASILAKTISNQISYLLLLCFPRFYPSSFKIGRLDEHTGLQRQEKACAEN